MALHGVALPDKLMVEARARQWTRRRTYYIGERKHSTTTTTTTMAVQHNPHKLIQENHLEIPTLLDDQTKLVWLVVLVLVSFGMMGYILWLVLQQERKEQKNK
jgi:hypothetical protein